jgi:hypothetical protein
MSAKSVTSTWRSADVTGLPWGLVTASTIAEPLCGLGDVIGGIGEQQGESKILYHAAVTIGQPACCCAQVLPALASKSLLPGGSSTPTR